MRKSYLLMHLSILLLGFSGIFGKLISLNEGLLTWYRMLFSSIILYFILKFCNIKTSSITIKEKIKLGKFGVLLAFSWVFFYGSIKYSNISVGVVCACMAGFFTAILEPIIYREKIKIHEILLSILTIVGIGLIFKFEVSHRLGIILGTIASLLASLYTISSRSITKKYDSKLINYYQMLTGTLCLGILLPIYLYYFPSYSIIPNLSDAFYLLFLAVFCTVGVYIIFMEILKEISAFTVNLSINLEPVYSIIIAFLFFGESKELSFTFFIGVLFVILSVLLQALIYLYRKKE